MPITSAQFQPKEPVDADGPEEVVSDEEEVG